MNLNLCNLSGPFNFCVSQLLICKSNSYGPVLSHGPLLRETTPAMAVLYDTELQNCKLSVDPPKVLSS